MRRRAFAVLALAGVLVIAVSIAAFARTAQSSGPVTIGMSGDQNTGFKFTGVPKTLKAGRVRFTFRNQSANGIRHNFTVVQTYGGAKPFTSHTVAAGKSRAATINLRKGTYVALCTIFNGGHAANGMLVAFQVQ
jgi:uncharacterized cupredoxin-like copper-binding protein